MESKKNQKQIIFIFLILLELVAIQNYLSAQDIEAKIKVISTDKIGVEVKFLNDSSAFASKDISFVRNVADASDLGERIENVKCFDRQEKSLEVKKLIAGEFQATEAPVWWQYEIKIKPSEKLTDSAHISWLLPDLGLLMLGDILPQFKAIRKPVSAKIILELPIDWKLASSETQINDKTLSVKNIANAVFLVGKNWRQKTIQIDKTTLSFAFAGDWKFSEAEAFEMARSILSEHQSVFREILIPKVQIILLPFPLGNSNPERWRAETRGSTVTVISGSLPFKSQAIQRLHEQLRHEIFHLWIPNSLALSGNYDWFYEGFTIYHALRTGIELNQIRFEDFLNTLSRAYEIAQMMAESQRLSLLEASNKRWAGTSNFIYAKGLVVAFLCDIALLRESKGKRNLKDIFRQVYQNYRVSNQIQDGNVAILSILKAYPELNSIVQNYIEGKSEIDWQSDLSVVGIEQEKSGFGISLTITAKPNGRQRDLLDKLGYNQWRKLLQKTK